MKLHRRAAFLLGVLLLASSAFARQLPNLDAFANAKPNPANDAAVQARARNFMRAGTQLRTEGRLGVPTFVWAGAATDTPTVHIGGNANLPPEEAAARSFVGSYASLYNLNLSDVTAAAVHNVHNTGKGGVIVKFKQTVGGIEIFREELSVLMTQKLELVALSGYISSASTPAAVGGSLGFARDNRTAAGDAFADLTGRSLGTLVAAGSRGGYDLFTAGTGASLDEPIRVKKVYFHVAGGLIPAYYVEVAAQEQSTSPDGIVASDEAPGLDYYSYVISAVDGSILFRKNLTDYEKANAKVRSNGTNDYVYRVWASNTTFIPQDEPFGNDVTPKVNPVRDGFQPPYVGATDVTLTNYPFFSRSATDPWLPPGATVTNGNNVDAYVDLDGTSSGANDGLTGSDFRASVTAPGQFLHTFDPTVAPTSTEQRNGALQQLFYDTNFLHDWYYDAGFDESAGNAQASNYGRGGVEGDSLKAEGQDGSGRNNANMSTPADGGRPRMQMYVFDALTAKYLDVFTPANIAGKRQVGTATLGPQSFDVSADIVYASPANACSALTNAAQVAGKIVIYERTTTCNFGNAFLNAQAAGPSAIVMANLQTTPDTLTNITGSSASFTKPWLVITWNMAQTIKAEIANGTVTGRARRDAGIDRDGTIDNQVIFHEWGHYISNRLIANAAGLGQAQGKGMGEGWGDFNSMMLSVRPDDTNTPSNATWNGVYGMASYVTSGDNGFGAGNDGLYWGIRRYPYSTDMTKNPLTFKHIQNGVALPVGPDVGFGASGSNNAEVHNVGEIWAVTLWECYASLLRDTQGATPRLTFQQAQDRMKSYYVASLKLTPPEPTILEARDAMLAAAYANDGVDYVEFWQAFAKRGMGVGAVGPDRYSVTHVGAVTESFVAGSDLQFVSASVDDGVANCDNDGYLDANEIGKLTFTLKNLGTQALSNTTGTVTSTNANVLFPNGNTITFAASEGGATTTGSVNVKLAAGSAGIQTLDYSLSFTDSALSVPGSRTASGVLRANVNLIPASTATDDVEAPTTAWTPGGNSALGYNTFFPWRRVAASGISHQWYAPDVNGQSDQWLTSPVFTVNGGGSINIQFDHSYSFEFDSSANYDGGKVEMSVNGGAFADVNTAIGGSGYNGSIAAGGAISGPGFVKTSAGTIHSSLTAAVAPGSTVQFRFRLGSDTAVGAFGWTVDNIAISGAVETPFPTLVADTGCSFATTTTVSSSPNPSLLGGNVTITAHVTSIAGVATSGTVTFKDGASPIGTGSVNASGDATYSTTALTVGTHSLTAQFGGAPGFYSSTSAAYSHVVSKPTTSIVLGSSLNPAGSGASVTFTATISASSGTPSGSISFLDGTTTLASIPISGGVATYTTSALAAGTHAITAVYASSASFTGSTSNVINQVVAYASSLALGSSANPAYVGTNVTITATITTTGSATGTVQFYDGMATLGSPVAVSGNSAAYSSSALSAGAHSITAVYSGDSTHAGSTASALSQQIDNLPVISLASATAHAVEGSGVIHITVNRTGVLTSTSSVAYTTSDGTAVAGTDYTTSSGTLNFAASASSGTIDITLAADDLTPENAKTITLTLSSPSGATLGTAVATITILDNDTHLADFTGDGSSDLVLRSYSTGLNALWTLNGTSYSSTVNLSSLPNTDYHIVGVADFDGDGKADILWRNQVTGANAIWLMTGTVHTGTVNLPGLANTAYHVGGVGDFNGDGKADIVWENYTTGALALWIMNGTTYSGVQNLPAIPPAYKVVGVGDFNYDGKADIVVRNDTNGADAVLLMNGMIYSTTVNLPTLTDLNYHIDGVGDLNNDGSADIVLRNYSTGANAIWVMDGTSLTSIANLPGLTNTSYEINGPR